MTNDKKSGFVTLVGRPNVGKSTLMNHLIGQKIAITSDKPQTTRNRIQTVYTDERGQIVFLDTPGIHKAKNKLGEYMVNVACFTSRWTSWSGERLRRTGRPRPWTLKSSRRKTAFCEGGSSC